MLVGGLDQVRKRLKQQLGQYEYKQRCESLMIQSSNYYATTENSSFKCQEYDSKFVESKFVEFYKLTMGG